MNSENESRHMSHAGIGTSIENSSAESHQFIENEMKELNLDLLQINPDYQIKPITPCVKTSPNKCLTVHEEINEFKQYLKQTLPKQINSPYSFLDVKIFKNESSAAAVTANGIFVLINLYNNEFFDLSLDSEPLSQILLCQNDSLALVKCKDTPKLFKIDLKKMKVVQCIEYDVSGIGKLSTGLSLFIFARIWEGKIWKISLSDLSEITEIFTDNTMISMNTSPSECIFIGTLDKRVLKLDFNGFIIKSRFFSFVIDAYIYCPSSFLLLAFPKSIKVLNPTTLEILKDIPTSIQSYSLTISPDYTYIIAGLQSGHLAFYSLAKQKSVKISVHKSSIISVSCTTDMLGIYTFSTDSKLALVPQPRLTVFKAFLETDLPINTISMTLPDLKEDFKTLCMAISPKKDLAMVGGESYTISVWDRFSMIKYGELMGHYGFVYSLSCLNETTLASAGGDCKVLLWNFRYLKKIGELSGHSLAVSAIVKIDEFRFASGSWDRTVVIWQWEAREQIFCIKDLPDKVVAMCTPYINKLFIGTKEEIICWDLTTYTEMFLKETESEISNFRIVENSRFLALGLEENSVWFENPFLAKDLEIWGKSETECFDFFYYLKKITENQSVEHRKEMDRFVVFPYKLNSLHFYAYFGLPGHLFSAVLAGGALLNTECGENPLSISIKMGQRECIQAIIKAAWEIKEKNPYLCSIVSVSILNDLNSGKLGSLSKLYKMLIISSVSKCDFNQCKKLPFFKTSRSFNEVKFKKGNKKHRVLKTCISFYLEPGSEKSLKFLYSLSQCNDRVLSSDFVRYFILVKWERVKVLVYLKFFLFFCYFLAVTGCCARKNRVLKMFSIVLGILLNGWEICATYTIKSFLGFLCGVQVCLLVYWISDDSIELFLFVLAALYGLDYFHIFVGSSQFLTFVKNLFKYFLSLTPFILLIFLSLYTLFHTYSIPLNHFRVPLKDIFQISTFLVTLVFFSDTKNPSQQTSYLINSILGVEVLLFCKRKDNTKEYIQVQLESGMTRQTGLKKLKNNLNTLSSAICSTSNNFSNSLQSTLSSLHFTLALLKHAKRRKSNLKTHISVLNPT